MIHLPFLFKHDILTCSIFLPFVKNSQTKRCGTKTKQSLLPYSIKLQIYFLGKIMKILIYLELCTPHHFHYVICRKGDNFVIK